MDTLYVIIVAQFVITPTWYMIGANKFDINVHTRYLLKFHLLHPFSNMFVGLWAHKVPLHHPPTLLWVPFVTF